MGGLEKRSIRLASQLGVNSVKVQRRMSDLMWISLKFDLSNQRYYERVHSSNQSVLSLCHIANRMAG